MGPRRSLSFHQTAGLTTDTNRRKHMKKILKIAVVAIALALMLIPDVSHAQFGIRRRTARRTTVVVASTVKHEEGAQAAQAQQQTAAAQQQAAAAEQDAAAAKQELAVAEGLLPLGTVAYSLPAGCVSTAINGTEYYHCGVNYYRAVFQGNSLVYVTAQPK